MRDMNSEFCTTIVSKWVLRLKNKRLVSLAVQKIQTLECDCITLDRAVIVNMMHLTSCRTFKDSTICRSPSEEGWLMWYTVDGHLWGIRLESAKTQWCTGVSKWLLITFLYLKFGANFSVRIDRKPTHYIHFHAYCETIHKQTSSRSQHNKMSPEQTYMI